MLTSPADWVEIPENRRTPGSINAELHELPVQREHVHDIKGMLLFFPRTGLVMVPTSLLDDGFWNCMVVSGNETYRRGGYDLLASRWELQRAVEVPVGAPHYPFDLTAIDAACRNFRAVFRMGDEDSVKVAVDRLGAALNGPVRG